MSFGARQPTTAMWACCPLCGDPPLLSLAVSPQVYKGKLHSGETVAIKVQRPGIADSIAVDMLLLRRLMKIVDRNTSEVRRRTVTLPSSACHNEMLGD